MHKGRYMLSHPLAVGNVRTVCESICCTSLFGVSRYRLHCLSLSAFFLNRREGSLSLADDDIGIKGKALSPYNPLFCPFNSVAPNYSLCLFLFSTAPEKPRADNRQQKANTVLLAVVLTVCRIQVTFVPTEQRVPTSHS